MNDTERIEERRIDWASAERVGGERQPDLAEHIVARHRAGDVPVDLAVADAGPPSSWFGGALVVVAVSVVLAVVFTGARDVGVAGPQDPAPPRVRVSTLAEIEALPADTRAVQCNGADDAILAALVRLRDLEHLEVHYHWRMCHGLMFKMMPPDDPPSITDAGLAHVAKLVKLRTLDIAGAWGVTGTGIEHLTRIPLLSTLRIRYGDIADEHLRWLAELAELTTLDLSFNHGFEAEGITHVLRCRGLRTLSLEGCQQLRATTLARLAELPLIEVLDLGSLDLLNWRWEPLGPDRVAPPKHRVGRRTVEYAVRDVTLHALAGAKRLRVLRIAQAAATTAGIAALGELSTLEELDLFGAHLSGVFPRDLPPSVRRLRVCGDYGDAFCRAVRSALPNLDALDVSACDEITDAGVAELVRMPTLRDLSLLQCRGLSPASMESLRGATQLRKLDLRHVDWVTAAHAAELRAALPELALTTSADRER